MDKEELLYRYFSNSLTEEQEVLFNELLKKDIEFKTQFEFEKNLKRVTREQRQEDLRSKLNQFETKINSGTKSKSSLLQYLKIAASILLLMTAGWFGYQNLFGVNYENLYKKNYNIYPNTVYTITRSDTINSVERQAFLAYEAGDYKQALDKFNEAESKDYFNFYKAQSYLGLCQYEMAKQSFENEVNENGQFIAEAHWYLALLHIREKQKDKALQSLNALINNHTYRLNEAKDLIKALE